MQALLCVVVRQLYDRDARVTVSTTVTGLHYHQLYNEFEEKVTLTFSQIYTFLIYS